MKVTKIIMTMWIINCQNYLIVLYYSIDLLPRTRLLEIVHLLLNAKFMLPKCQGQCNKNYNKRWDYFADSTVFLGLNIYSSLHWKPQIDTLSGIFGSAAYAVRTL